MFIAFFRTILYLPIFNLLIWLVNYMPGHSVGLAIIIVTVLVRLLLLPSTRKMLAAQTNMKKLQPQLEEIKKQHKGDKQAEAKATMELYKQHKVSPWGSCLPLLIQYPLLLVLYFVFRDGLSMQHFDANLYHFIPRPDSINTQLLGIDLAQPDKIYLPVIVAVLQLLQSLQMTGFKNLFGKKKEKQDAATRIIGYQTVFLFPIFTYIIALKLPAALPLYWGITTLFMIGQQLVINRVRKGGSNTAVTVSVRKPN